MKTQTIPLFEANKEYAVGEKFIYEDIVFVCKEETDCFQCVTCAFEHNPLCRDIICLSKHQQDEYRFYFDFDDELRKLLSETPVGQIAVYRGYRFKVYSGNRCSKCFFRRYSCHNVPCFSHERKDKQHVSYIMLCK